MLIHMRTERSVLPAPRMADHVVKTLANLLILALAAAPAAAADGVTPLGLAGEREPTVETIQQRDAEGRVRVRRQVRLNERGDYVNHGPWRAWNTDGELTGQGRYSEGKPTGVWSRWATVEDSPLLGTLPYSQCEGPFLSQATYRDGELQGGWSIFDASGRLVSEIAFRNGRRHGKAVLRTLDGQVYRRSRFEDGVPEGEVEQLSDAGELEVVATFEAGRRQIERVEKYEGGALKLREAWLGPLTTAVEADDPWRVRLARFEAAGEELRHGTRGAWWPNGQPKLRADYLLGKAIGRARWWHENGQLALEGNYAKGVADGSWGWWREDGARAAACRYVAGRPVGETSLWAADGRRIESSPTAVARHFDGLLIR